jgi:hypothetical protein
MMSMGGRGWGMMNMAGRDSSGAAGVGRVLEDLLERLELQQQPAVAMAF